MSHNIRYPCCILRVFFLAIKFSTSPTPPPPPSSFPMHTTRATGATLSDLSFILVKNGTGNFVELGIIAESLQMNEGC